MAEFTWMSLTEFAKLAQVASQVCIWCDPLGQYIEISKARMLIAIDLACRTDATRQVEALMSDNILYLSGKSRDQAG
jgi:hypothetical protein